MRPRLYSVLGAFFGFIRCLHRTRTLVPEAVQSTATAAGSNCNVAHEAVHCEIPLLVGQPGKWPCAR